MYFLFEEKTLALSSQESRMYSSSCICVFIFMFQSSSDPKRGRKTKDFFIKWSSLRILKYSPPRTVRFKEKWRPKVHSYWGLEFMKAFSTIDKANDLETFAIGSRNLWTSWPSSSVWRPIPGRLQSEEISAAAAKAQVSFGARARECQGRCGVPDWVGQACWWLLPPASSSWSLKT